MQATQAASRGDADSMFGRFARSSIGAKSMMALSGAGIWLYLLLHIAGNLQVFKGPEVFNGYAELLQGSAPLLWTERVIVFGLLLLHVASAIRVTQINRAARPVRYAERHPQVATPMSRTMVVSGLVILPFFVFHILHFTVHAGGADYVSEILPDGRARPDAFTMVQSAFKKGWVVVIYVVGQAFLWSHLLHGLVSMFQSLGAYRAFRHRTVRWGMMGIATALAAGAISIPLRIYWG